MNKHLTSSFLVVLALSCAAAARAAGGGAIGGSAPWDKTLAEPSSVACAQPDIRLRGGTYVLTFNGCHYNTADTGDSVYLTWRNCLGGISGQLSCVTPQKGPRVCRGTGRNAGIELIVADARSFVLKTAPDREGDVYVLPPDVVTR